MHISNLNKLFDLKQDRYQGPALLSKNTTSIFEKKDFKSLLKLEKRNQFDKIKGNKFFFDDFV